MSDSEICEACRIRFYKRFMKPLGSRWFCQGCAAMIAEATATVMITEVTTTDKAGWPPHPEDKPLDQKLLAFGRYLYQHGYVSEWEVPYANAMITKAERRQPCPQSRQS